ncbi:ChaN family lipoprotein [Zhouia amylolytica]|uniref:ChaN family lipoprotein n=1 Tax=Zhouia amylolytica TaxID=376730 RepID=UPI0020CF7E95|nr:ChaN family lipoprotein [Zhouia amylolytica]MCQ0112341.1 ChaN family lipoprotein [Zhouia amylolytica]
MQNITNYLLLFIGFITLSATAQIKDPYRIFNQKGKQVSYKKMLKDLSRSEVILFGELHNNPIAHWLEYEVTSDLLKSDSLILGAEMFEADDQNTLNDYLMGFINAKTMDSIISPWPNYKTDYKPLVDLAKRNKLSFIATNVPRKYANLVFKKGFEALEPLTDQEKNYIAKLPIVYDPNLPSYKAMLEMMPGHGGANLPKAQAIKDATMAFFILKHLKPNHLFIHYNGSYHSNNFEGIGWYLKRQRSELNIKTINIVEQKALRKPEAEHMNSAHYIIVVDKDMTKTY